MPDNKSRILTQAVIHLMLEC